MRRRHILKPTVRRGLGTHKLSLINHAIFLMSLVLSLLFVLGWLTFRFIQDCLFENCFVCNFKAVMFSSLPCFTVFMSGPFITDYTVQVFVLLTAVWRTSQPIPSFIHFVSTLNDSFIIGNYTTQPYFNIQMKEEIKKKIFGANMLPYLTP